MNLFDCRSYKEFVLGWVKARPSQGRGEWSRIAKHLRVNTSLVSQIFRGDKELSLEQAALLTEYLTFDDLESEYFLLLVQQARAGSVKLKKILSKRMEALSKQGNQVTRKLKNPVVMDENARAEFYSMWQYSAVRLLTSIEGYQTVDKIAERLNLSRQTVSKLIKFLLAYGLCQSEGDLVKVGVPRTHVAAESSFAYRHHLNWRMKALEKLPNLSPEYLHFTSPFTVSREDFPKLRKILVDAIGEFGKVVDASPSEDLYCVTLDLFGL